MLKNRLFILVIIYLVQISHVNGQWRPDGVHPNLTPNSHINTPMLNKNVYNKGFASTTSDSILWNLGNSTGSSAVVSDTSGNVYALGSYRGASTINGVQLPGYGGLDFVIYKFNPAGDLIWHITGCGSGDDYAYITTDQSGNTYLSGFSTAACTITGKNGTSYTAYRSGGNEGFIVKIEPEGQIQWGVSLAGGSATDGFNSVHVDELGNVFATAVFNGCCGSTGSATVFFPDGSRVINSIGYRTGALLKFDSGGTFKWSVRVGNRDVSIDNAVTDSNQNVYFTGVQRAWSSGTSGSMIDGTGASSTILNPGIGNSFLVKLDAAGSRIFGLAIGNLGSGTDASSSITDFKIDGLNNLYLTGSYFGGEAVFNSTNSTTLKLPSSSTIMGFLAQYSANGTPQRVSNLNVSGSSNTWPQELAWFQEKLYVAGAYRANTFNTGNYGFVSELNEEFTMTETKTIIGSGSENAVGLNATDNQLFASGYYGNNSSFDEKNFDGVGSFLWLVSSVTFNQHNLSKFSTTLTITNSNQTDLSLVFGVSDSATDGYDDQLDQLAPPAPPTGSFDARIRFNGQDYFTFVQPPAQDSISWPLLVRPGTGFAPLTLQWDPTTLPKEGAMTLSWQAGETPMRVNMRTLSSIQLHAEAETALTLVYQPTTQVDVSYQAGWNMLGLPVSVEHQNYLELFPLAQTNSLFGYTNSYVESDRFTQGNGYWLRFESAGTQSLKGYPVEEIEVEVGAGWNLISGTTHTGEIADTTGLIVSGTLFGYKGAYYSASVLEPGQAYWVVASDSGAIRVTSSPAAKTYAKEGHEALTTVPNELYRIQVSTGEGYERALYVVEAYEAEQEHPLRYALPPVPPSGSFDVRFTDGRWVSVDEVVEILVQQPSGAVSVSVSSSEGDAWVIDEYSGAEQVRRTSLSDGESLALLQQTTRILGGPAMVMTSREQPEASLPEEFALEQNYPNPFNPSTQIRYGIPQASEVELTVFNMLGQKVATLVNQKQSAGWHTVTFDASGLSSGFYIYRIQAGSFISTKKLMLIK